MSVKRKQHMEEPKNATGIYAIVWDDEGGANNDPTRILDVTPGGFPHVVVAFTGDAIDQDDLFTVNHLCMRALFNQRITVENVAVYTVEVGGVPRYDVVLELSDEDEDMFKRVRSAYVEPAIGDRNRNSVVMHKPVIVLRTFLYEKYAYLHRNSVRETLQREVHDSKLMLRITGTTLD